MKRTPLQGTTGTVREREFDFSHSEFLVSILLYTRPPATPHLIMLMLCIQDDLVGR